MLRSWLLALSRCSWSWMRWGMKDEQGWNLLLTCLVQQRWWWWVWWNEVLEKVTEIPSYLSNGRLEDSAHRVGFWYEQGGWFPTVAVWWLPCPARPCWLIAAMREGYGVSDTGCSWASAAESLLEAAAIASIHLILLAAAGEPLDDDRYWILFS